MLFYLLEVVKVLLHLCKARGLLAHFTLKSYQIYVLLYISSATIQHYSVMKLQLHHSDDCKYAVSVQCCDTVR